MKIIHISAACFLLASCATSYKPDSFWNDGGFSETELQPGLFRVTFKGNEFTKPERTADFALLRAADLCINRGQSHMYLGDIATESVQTGYIPGSSTTTIDADVRDTYRGARISGTARTSTTPGTALYSPRTGLLVACSLEETSETWDANFISKTMRAKYEIEN